MKYIYNRGSYGCTTQRIWHAYYHHNPMIIDISHIGNLFLAMGNHKTWMDERREGTKRTSLFIYSVLKKKIQHIKYYPYLHYFSIIQVHVQRTLSLIMHKHSTLIQGSLHHTFHVHITS